MNIRFLEHRGGSSQCCLKRMWVVKEEKLWVDERKKGDKAEESVWPKVWSRTFAFWECKKVSVV